MAQTDPPVEFTLISPPVIYALVGMNLTSTHRTADDVCTCKAQLVPTTGPMTTRFTISDANNKVCSVRSKLALANHSSKMYHFIEVYRSSRTS